MEKDLSKAFAEVLYILNNIEIEYKNKVPKDVFQMFSEDCDVAYLNELIESKSDFMEKDYSKDALSIIAYLNLKYWCETKEEKRYYRNMYLKKDKKNRTS